jgi:hypothetical protein
VAPHILIRTAGAALAVALAAIACSAGDPRPCSVTCGTAGECPDGTTCGDDQYCYGADETPGSCAQGTEPDAGDDASDDGTDGNDGDGTDDGADDGGDTGACDPCDPVEQCGCAESEACYVADGSEVICILAGSLGEEGSCTSDTDCRAGYDCVTEGPLVGHCQQYCTDDEGCGGGLRLCNRIAGNTDVRTCTSDCDPLDVTACAVGEKCTLDEGAGGRHDTRCLDTGGLQYLDVCFEQYDCDAGLICAAVGTEFGTCEFLCTIGGADCGAGVECVGFLTPILFNDVEYGYCLF